MHFSSSVIKTACDRVGSSEDPFYPPLFVHIVEYVYLMLTTHIFSMVTLLTTSVILPCNLNYIYRVNKICVPLDSKLLKVHGHI